MDNTERDLSEDASDSDPTSLVPRADRDRAVPHGAIALDEENDASPQDRNPGTSSSVAGSSQGVFSSQSNLYSQVASSTNINDTLSEVQRFLRDSQHRTPSAAPSGGGPATQLYAETAVGPSTPAYSINDQIALLQRIQSSPARDRTAATGTLTSEKHSSSGGSSSQSISLRGAGEVVENQSDGASTQQTPSHVHRRLPSSSSMLPEAQQLQHQSLPGGVTMPTILSRLPQMGTSQQQHVQQTLIQSFMAAVQPPQAAQMTSPMIPPARVTGIASARQPALGGVLAPTPQASSTIPALTTTAATSASAVNPYAVLLGGAGGGAALEALARLTTTLGVAGSPVGASTTATTSGSVATAAAAVSSSSTDGVAEDPPQKRLKRTYKHESFPVKLHRLLLQVETENKDDIISFNFDGTVFVIHQPDAFEEEIIPRFFKHSKLSSFKRQLSMYGFTRVPQGPDEGGFSHPSFRKDRPDLCKDMDRIN
jgi:hypothetical protein